MKRPHPLLLPLTLLPSVLASFCGQAAIPFTFQALRSGQPVLGCARPRCFGWNANGTRADDTAQFYRIHGKEDGYLRRSDIVLRAPSRPAVSPQTSKCEQDYRSTSCDEGQWVGGISPLANAKVPEMHIRCCSYPLLFDSDDRGVAPIKAGQVFIGGEAVEGSRVVGFDYISDIVKKVFPNNTVLYEISVRRMSCSDEEDKPIAPIPNNADLQNLDGDIQFSGRDQQTPPGAFSKAAQTVSAEGTQERHYGSNVHPRILQYGVRQQSVPVPVREVLPQPVQQQNLAPVGEPIPQIVQQQQPMALNGAGYPPLQQPYQQQMFPGSVPPAPPKSVQVFPQGGYPVQQQQNLAPLPMAVAQTPFPTLPPLTLPKLDQLPQIQIPSVEQVEEVIPPMQRAILTNIAKFFGVL